MALLCCFVALLLSLLYRASLLEKTSGCLELLGVCLGDWMEGMVLMRIDGRAIGQSFVQVGGEDYMCRPA